MDLVSIDTFSDFINVCYRGVAFDMTAIIYINSLFILLSILPLVISKTKVFQKVIFYVYFVTNLIAYAFNFVDLIYYRFSQTRTTTSGLESIENESNKSGLFFTFLFDYWHVFLLFFIVSFIWVKLYKKVQFDTNSKQNISIGYFLTSVAALLIVATMAIGGIRGDFKHSTRPITLVDASRHVKVLSQADMVLNTPFAIIRTINKNFFKKRSYLSEAEVAKSLSPIKKYDRIVAKKPNVVILIVESMSREYIGAFNKKMNIDNYESFTPFLDSLSSKSLIFPNSFANGRKSIHAMSSILAGIPSFKVAYTSSPFSNQNTQSIVSVLNEMDYDTSFFHGAPNGSMGFLGFSNILGFDHYYGKTEYNNDDDFDGIWGIWDRPFLKYVNKELDEKKEPFMATVFTLSSHSPFKVPENETSRYPKGHNKMHQCIGYTDSALEDFFKEAKTKDWYDNTIFVLTGDHTSILYYFEYAKALNRYAVPIIIHKPNSDLIGDNYDLAEQIDIYPTLTDLVGYNKPIRSWGRSLMKDSIVKPFAFTHNGLSLQLQQGDYIYVSTDDKELGFYDIKDKGLTTPLMNVPDSIRAPMVNKSKAFLQDYMNRIVDKKLIAE